MNAPVGSDHELNAPWNRSDLPDKKCKQCKGVGYIYIVENWNDPHCPTEKEECEFCEGTGIKN